MTTMAEVLGNFLSNAACFLVLNCGENAIWIFNLCILGLVPDSAKYQAAVGLARVFFNISCWSILCAFVSTLQVYVPPAFGADKPHLVAAYCQRAFILCTIVAIPCLVFQFFFGHVLYIFQQTDEIINLSTTYLYYLLPSIPLMVCDRIHRIVLQTAELNFDLYAITITTFVVNCAITWLFVFTWDTGYLGLIFGMYIGYIWRTLVQIVSLYNHNLLKNIWSLTACNVLMDYEENVQMSRIGLQMVFQNMLNWWVFECIVILASWSTHGDPIYTAIAAIYTEVLEFMAMVWLGVAQASSIPLGAALGDGNASHAAKLFNLSAIWTFVIGVFVNLPFILFPYTMFKLFSTSSEVRDGLVDIAWNLALSSQIMVPFFHSSCVCYSIDETGWLIWGGAIGFYVMSLPLCGYMLWSHPAQSNYWKLIISLSTFGIGALLQTVYIYSKLFAVSWESQSEKALKKLSKSEAATLADGDDEDVPLLRQKTE